jgi:multidrug efflux pump subunit AcrA (membrane-fusion protein)
MHEEHSAQADASSTRSRWRRRPRALIAGALVIGLVAGTALWLLFGRDDDSAAVTTTTTKQLVTVTRGPLTETISAEGTVAAAQTDDLSFGASGTVTAVNVSAGDKVAAGQVLATLDSASLQSDVADAQSDLADAQATLADDQSSGASSTQIAVDQTRVQSAQDALTSAQNALAGATLTATFDGTITTVNVSVGEKLSSGTGGTDQTGSDSGTGNSSSNLGSGSNQPDGSNGDDSSSSTPDIEVVSAGKYASELQVDSSQVDSVKLGAEVTVSVSTGSSTDNLGGFFPRQIDGNGTTGNGTTGNNGGTGTTGNGTTVTGIVTDVGKVADASSGVAQYPVSIDFSTDDASYSIGTSITGAISSAIKDDVVQVPVRAVSTSNGQSTVTVALDGTTTGRTETVKVTTGDSAGGQIEITGGLEEGQQVIVENVVVTGGDTGNGNGGELPGGGKFPGGRQVSGGGQ